MFPKTLAAMLIALCLMFSLFIGVLGQTDQQNIGLTIPQTARRGDEVEVTFWSIPEADYVSLIAGVALEPDQIPLGCVSNSKFEIVCWPGEYSMQMRIPQDRDLHQIVFIVAAIENGTKSSTAVALTIEEYILFGRVVYTDTSVPMYGVSVETADSTGTMSATTDIYGVFEAITDPGIVTHTLAFSDAKDIQAVTAEDAYRLFEECLLQANCTADMDINQDGKIDDSDVSALMQCVVGESLGTICGKWTFLSSTASDLVDHNASPTFYGTLGGDITRNWGTLPKEQRSSYILMTPSGIYSLNDSIDFVVQIVPENSLSSFSLSLEVGKFNVVESDVRIPGMDRYAINISNGILKVAAFNHRPKQKFEVHVRLNPDSVEDASSISLTGLFVGEDAAIGLIARSDLDVVAQVEINQDFSENLYLPIATK